MQLAFILNIFIIIIASYVLLNITPLSYLLFFFFSSLSNLFYSLLFSSASILFSLPVNQFSIPCSLIPSSYPIPFDFLSSHLLLSPFLSSTFLFFYHLVLCYYIFSILVLLLPSATPLITLCKLNLYINSHLHPRRSSHHSPYS